MQKTTFLTRAMVVMTWLCAVATMTANPISEQQAYTIAASFMSSHRMAGAKPQIVRKAPRIGSPADTDKAAYYVFNAGIVSGGYVIVSGDDRAPAVLGYSDQGAFDANNVPEAMQELLDGYTAQIEAISNGAAEPVSLRSSGSAISPMVNACWSQNSPYNILLPYLPSGKHANVGCVATAMAQVMYYWQWPARPTRTIPAYTSTYTSSGVTLTFDMPELPVTDFNWNMMQDTYQTTDTMSDAAFAAAQLSLYCAQALEMTFKPSSSGANTTNISNRAAAYFDYDASAHMVERSAYTSQGWADLIYSELEAGRPVIYSGRKATGGHSFICDGCDGNGMFHFNWGWNGNSNGYFLLNVLNPDEQGTGSASGAYGYIMEQAVLVGFQPNMGGSHFFELTAAAVTLNSYVDTRSRTTEPFTAYVSGEFHNYTSDTLAVRFGWGLFDGDEMIERLYNAYNLTLRPGYLHTHTNRMLEFGEGLTSGTYRIMPMYSEYGQNNWRPCAGAEQNYIEVTINGNQCTFTGYGTVGACDYDINDIAITGYMHNGRPINFDVNMTNNGQSDNKLLYMFIDGTFAAVGYVALATGETGDVHYTYLFQYAGNYTLTWSWNENGSDPIATRTITINPMPAANLSATYKVLHVADDNPSIIESDKFSIELTITNYGETTYDEDISAKLYKNIYGGTGTNVQGINKHLILGPGETTTMQFDMANVIDGWKYFAIACFYSEGQQITFARTTSFTFAFPEEPEFIPGDVNNDKVVDVSDVTLIISYILGTTDDINLAAADVMTDGTIDVADVTVIISLILNAD